VSRTIFNKIFSVLSTIFYQKSLKLTKNYSQKLIAPNALTIADFLIKPLKFKGYFTQDFYKIVLVDRFLLKIF